MNVYGPLWCRVEQNSQDLMELSVFLVNHFELYPLDPRASIRNKAYIYIYVNIYTHMLHIWNIY